MDMTKEDFFKAVEEDDFLKVMLYVHAGANIDFRDDLGRPPLQIALENGHVGLIAVLIDAGANPVRRNKFGENIMTWAVKYADADTIAELLSKEIDPNMIDGEGNLPLHIATTYQKWDIVKILLNYGADPLIDTPTSPGLLYGLLMSEELDNYLDLIKLIIQNMDINKQDNDGNTILNYVIKIVGRKDITHFVLKNKADPNILNNDGNSALHNAIINLESRSSIGLLLGFGANPYSRNSSGRNAFDLMRDKNEFRLLKLLEEYTQRYADRYKQYV